MSSEMKVRKIWPRSYTTSYMELGDGVVTIFPKLVVDTLECATIIGGIDSSGYVLTTGNQTIAGIKTFTSIPVLPASNPTTDNQVARKKYVDDVVASVSVVPVGTILPYAGDTAPTGFFICNGDPRDINIYSALFAVVAFKYGGSGSTFYLPNLKGRVVVGYDATITDFNLVGKTGGEQTHVLTIDEMPSHTHSVPCQPNTAASGGAVAVGNAARNTGSTGGSQAHNNLQPYCVVNYIIKY